MGLRQKKKFPSHIAERRDPDQIVSPKDLLRCVLGLKQFPRTELKNSFFEKKILTVSYLLRGGS
jgi:hypothetical protein